MANKQSETINLTIKSNQGTVMNNEAVFAVTSKNKKGLFDVLPEHENFISIVKDIIIVHKTRKEKKEIKIDTGVLRATNNKVNIFLGMHTD